MPVLHPREDLDFDLLVQMVRTDFAIELLASKKVDTAVVNEQVNKLKEMMGLGQAGEA